MLPFNKWLNPCQTVRSANVSGQGKGAETWRTTVCWREHNRKVQRLMWAELTHLGCIGLSAVECSCTCMCVCARVSVCVCACVCVSVSVCVHVSRSQSLTPPWQVCGPSPPPTSPSAACPWPSGDRKHS